MESRHTPRWRAGFCDYRCWTPPGCCRRSDPHTRSGSASLGLWAPPPPPAWASLGSAPVGRCCSCPGRRRRSDTTSPPDCVRRRSWPAKDEGMSSLWKDPPSPAAGGSWAVEMIHKQNHRKQKLQYYIFILIYEFLIFWATVHLSVTLCSRKTGAKHD